MLLFCFGSFFLLAYSLCLRAVACVCKSKCSQVLEAAFCFFVTHLLSFVPFLTSVLFDDFLSWRTGKCDTHTVVSNQRKKPFILFLTHFAEIRYLCPWWILACVKRCWRDFYVRRKCYKNHFQLAKCHFSVHQFKLLNEESLFKNEINFCKT